MKGTFTHSLFFTLLRTSLVLLSGLLLWMAAAATSDIPCTRRAIFDSIGY
jgi:hypothetical protein